MKKALVFLIAAFILFCAACSDSKEYPAPMTLSTDMPATRPGENATIGYFTAQLYFVSQDGRTLSCEEREIELSADTSIVELTIRALMDGPSDRLLLRSIPTGLILSRIELSDDVCNVYFVGDFPEEMRSWLIARTAIASTITALGPMSTVNVYLNEMEPGYIGRALGAQTSIAFSLDAYLTNLHQEYEVLPLGVTAEAAATVIRNMTMYYLDDKGKLLTPQNKQVSYSVISNKAELAGLIIESLLIPPSVDSSLVSAIPAGTKLLSVPAIEYKSQLIATPSSTTDGDIIDPFNNEASQTDIVADINRDEPCTVSVMLTEPTVDYDKDRLCGAITLSLTGFLPKVEGVYISFARTNVVTGEQIIAPLNDGKPFTRTDYAHLIGYGVYIDCPRADGVTLLHTECMVKGVDAYNLRTRLELLLGYLAVDSDTKLSTEDILGVYQVNDLIVINWADGFHDYVMEYIGSGEEDSRMDRESSFVYSIINTMCELPQIQRVWMLENGKKLGRLENIYLGNALYKHSGILAGE